MISILNKSVAEQSIIHPERWIVEFSFIRDGAESKCSLEFLGQPSDEEVDIVVNNHIEILGNAFAPQEINQS